MTESPLRAARWSAHHPWRAIACWFAIIAVCLGVGLAVGTRSADTEDYRVGEAGRAETLAAAGDLQRRAEEQVLITTDPDGQDRTASAAANSIMDGMSALPEVQQAIGPLHSNSGAALVIRVIMRGPELDAKSHIEPLITTVERAQRDHPELRIELTGAPSISRGVDAQRGADLARSEAITLPITVIILMVIFGSMLAAAIPVLVAMSSIAAAVGLSMLASHLFPDAGVGMNVIILIGMAVGVDYSLFYLTREREERARHGGTLGPAELVELAAATSGRAVIGSGLAVAICGATLYLATDVIFASLATATIVVTVAAMASSSTILPALLVLVGRRRERLRGNRSGDRTPRRWATGRFRTALMTPAARHPWLTLGTALAILVVLAAPLTQLRLADISMETHSMSIPAMRVRAKMIAEFPELRTAHQIVVRADAAEDAAVRAALAQVEHRALTDPLFIGTPVQQTSADRRTHTMTLAIDTRNDTPEAVRSLQSLRHDLLPSALGPIHGAEWAVSGDTARLTDYADHQDTKLPLVLIALLLTTFVMTVVIFRSFVLGVLGAILNLLSTAAALGVLVFVFQRQWAQGLLDFTATGSIGSRVPLFLVVILFGLSMDYQVFVVSRIREGALRGLSTQQAVIDGMARSASVVTSAAIVMITVFASFVAVELIEMKEMGFALAVGVFLDAFVVRVLVLPAALVLLGRLSWWPSRYSDRPSTAQSDRGRDRAGATAE